MWRLLRSNEIHLQCLMDLLKRDLTSAEINQLQNVLRENIQQTSFVLCPEMKLKLNGCHFDTLKDILWSLQRHKWKGREGGKSQ